jgi:hypothetical protein
LVKDGPAFRERNAAVRLRIAERCCSFVFAATSTRLAYQRSAASASVGAFVAISSEPSQGRVALRARR